MSSQFIGLFPGQGSQKVGMGKDLYDSDPKARSMFDQADEVLGFKLSSLMFAGPESELIKTEFVQPAILVCSCVAFQLARERLNTNTLVATAGHSLGEYSALVAAGAIDFGAAVALVNKRGKYMQEAVPLGAGKMIAVLGMELADLEQKLSEVDGIAEIANINAPGQIVVSGAASSIDQAKTLLTGVRVIDLAVSAPFHCSLMRPAANQLAEDLDRLEIKPAQVPVISNYLARPLQEPEQIRQALKDQVCGRVRWQESMQWANMNYPSASFVEFGVGGVLSGLLKRIDKSRLRFSAGSLEEINGLQLS